MGAEHSHEEEVVDATAAQSSSSGVDGADANADAAAAFGIGDDEYVNGRGGSGDGTGGGVEGEGEGREGSSLHHDDDATAADVLRRAEEERAKQRELERRHRLKKRRVRRAQPYDARRSSSGREREVGVEGEGEREQINHEQREGVDASHRPVDVNTQAHTHVQMRASIFNRDYTAGDPAAAASSSSAPIGVRPLEVHETTDRSRERSVEGQMGNSDGRGSRDRHASDGGGDDGSVSDGDGSSAGVGLGEDLAEMDASELQSLAFKTQAQVEEAAGKQFEYELPELAARMGSKLKILAAGYDEALMHVSHTLPLPSTYNAYNVAPSLGYDGMDGVGEYGSAYGYDPYDSFSYGSEYRPPDVPFDGADKVLADAASRRRRLRIREELAWQAAAKEKKAKEKAAARRKALESESSERSVNSYSRSRGGYGSTRVSLAPRKRGTYRSHTPIVTFNMRPSAPRKSVMPHM